MTLLDSRSIPSRRQLAGACCACRVYQSASKLAATLGKEMRFHWVASFKADTFYCTAFELARVKSHAISTKSTPGTTQTICCPMNPIQ